MDQQQLRSQQTIKIDHAESLPQGTSQIHIDQAISSNDNKKVKPEKELTGFKKLLENQHTVFVLEILVVLLFAVFVFKLCCNKTARDPRIVRGRGTGSNIGGAGRKMVNASSRKSNHRHGMKIPKVVEISQSESSSGQDDF